MAWQVPIGRRCGLSETVIYALWSQANTRAITNGIRHRNISVCKMVPSPFPCSFHRKQDHGTLVITHVSTFQNSSRAASGQPGPRRCLHRRDIPSAGGVRRRCPHRRLPSLSQGRLARRSRPRASGLTGRSPPYACQSKGRVRGPNMRGKGEGGRGKGEGGATRPWPPPPAPRNSLGQGAATARFRNCPSRDI